MLAISAVPGDSLITRARESFLSLLARLRVESEENFRQVFGRMHLLQEVQRYRVL